ncbi:hypothetical protein L1887_54942 [Cichorium endivia]|nr:hypothetical protein L1887_54942 [Cichorium endivia]
MFGASGASDEVDARACWAQRRKAEGRRFMGGRMSGQSSCHGGPAARVQPACSQPNPRKKQKSQNVRVPTRRSAAWLDPSLSSENVKSISITFRISENSQATLAGTTAWTDGRVDGWIASAVQRVGQDGRRWSRELGPNRIAAWVLRNGLDCVTVRCN